MHKNDYFKNKFLFYICRYAVQLMSPASLVAKVKNRACIKKQDIDEVKTLFRDAKSSAKILAECSDKYLK